MQMIPLRKKMFFWHSWMIGLRHSAGTAWDSPSYVKYQSQPQPVGFTRETSIISWTLQHLPKFVPNIAVVASLLDKQLWNEQLFTFAPLHDKKQVTTILHKDVMTSPPVPVLPYTGGDVTFITDASILRTRFVLLQKQQDDGLRTTEY